MKKDMPLEGLRWSRDSGSTLCDTPQNGRSRTGWGGNICFFRYEFLVFGVYFMGECDTLLVFFNVFRLYSRSNYQQRLIIRHLFIEAYRPFNTPHSTFTIL